MRVYQCPKATLDLPQSLQRCARYSESAALRARIECRLSDGGVVSFPADAGRQMLDDSRLAGQNRLRENAVTFGTVPAPRPAGAPCTWNLTAARHAR